jgi:quinol monooxygenase YgiN
MTVLDPAAGIPRLEPACRSHRLGPASVPERPRRPQPGTDGHTVDPLGSDAVPILVADGDLATPAGPRPVLRHPRAVPQRQSTPAHANADRKELTMPHVLVHQRITGFDRWKEAFDRLGPARTAASCRSATVFRNREDPHEVVVLLDFADLARARQHIGSAELRRAWQDAGVTDAGTRSVLDVVEAGDA